MKFPRFLLVLPLFLLSCPVVWAQEVTEEATEPLYTEAELHQLLAPIALYPDVLLSQVLMASTYPLEVVEASRWSRANPELDGDAAVQAVQDKAWDISVKALVGFPDLIQRMDENLEWTRQLGDAFLEQEEQVMEVTQQLRERAFEEGSLEEMEYVSVERQENQIIIEPADVHVVYVPYYSTRVVYGDWFWHDYPPVYWSPPYGSYSSFGISWSSGYRVSSHFYYSTCHWPSRQIVIVNSYRGPNRFDFHRAQVMRRYDHYAHVWRHDPYHRKGVRYRDKDWDERYRHERRDRDQRVRIEKPDRDRIRIDRSLHDRRDNLERKRPDYENRRPQPSIQREQRIAEYRQKQKEVLRERVERRNSVPSREQVRSEPVRMPKVAPASPPVRRKPAPTVTIQNTKPSPKPTYQSNTSNRNNSVMRDLRERSRSAEKRIPARRVDP